MNPAYTQIIYIIFIEQFLLSWCASRWTKFIIRNCRRRPRLWNVDFLISMCQNFTLQVEDPTFLALLVIFCEGQHDRTFKLVTITPYKSLVRLNFVNFLALFRNFGKIVQVGVLGLPRIDFWGHFTPSKSSRVKVINQIFSRRPNFWKFVWPKYSFHRLNLDAIQTVFSRTFQIWPRICDKSLLNANKTHVEVGKYIFSKLPRNFPEYQYFNRNTFSRLAKFHEPICFSLRYGIHFQILGILKWKKRLSEAWDMSGMQHNDLHHRPRWLTWRKMAQKSICGSFSTPTWTILPQFLKSAKKLTKCRRTNIF